MVSFGGFGLDHVDLLYCHRPDPETPIDETVWAMHDIVERGQALYWGTSEWSAQQIQDAAGIAAANHLHGPTMEQPQYNLFHRAKVEVEFGQIYKTVGLGTTIWSPLASGLLTGKMTPQTTFTDDDHRKYNEDHDTNCFRDAIDRITIHPLEDPARFLDRRDDHREPGCREHEIGGGPRRVGGTASPRR